MSTLDLNQEVFFWGWVLEALFAVKIQCSM
jgi:hypothetical protein